MTKLKLRLRSRDIKTEPAEPARMTGRKVHCSPRCEVVFFGQISVSHFF